MALKLPRRPSSKEAMTALRARREAAGLVQMNVWIRRDEVDAFRLAVKPFQQRAKVAAAQVPAVKQVAQAKPLQGAAVCFVQRVPPAVVRDRMKAAGWRYDRETDAWLIAWEQGAGDTEERLIEELRERYGTEVVRGG